MAIYLALPAGDAPMLVHDVIREHSSILELGSGPGRLTRVLIALGHRVTAVDDSAEMLKHVTGARTEQADVFDPDLDLGTRFDVVLAASHLINRPGARNRRTLLRSGRRHLVDGGSLLVERYPPDWLLTAPDRQSQVGPVRLSFHAGHIKDGVRSAAITYELAGQSWKQEFEAENVTDHILEEDAAAEGLTVVESLDDAHTWLRLVAIAEPIGT